MINLPTMLPIDWQTAPAITLAILGTAVLASGGRIIANVERTHGQSMPQTTPNLFAAIAAGFWSISLSLIFVHPSLGGEALKNLAAASPNSYLALTGAVVLFAGVGVLPVCEWTIRTFARSEYPQIRFKRFLWVT